MNRRVPAGDFDYEGGGSGAYRRRRRPDPRIAAQIDAALGEARTVLNVGAGAGSYEPSDRYVLAVEPSAAMRAARPSSLAPALDAVAEDLPFEDGSFDAAMAILSVHQWRDLERGIAEMRRVSRGTVVVLTLDGDAMARLWIADYVPEVIATDQARFPSIERLVDALGGDVEILPVPMPHDCTDGISEAYYARPEAFLDPEVRAAQSGWMLADPAAVSRGVRRLSEDLRTGAWDRKYGHLRRAAEHLGAVRLLVTRPAGERSPRANAIAETFTDWSKTDGRELLPGLVSWSGTGEALQLVRTQLAPGIDFEPHSHPHEQFMAVLSGTFECRVNGETIRSGPGGVFYFAPDQPHGGRVIGDEPVMVVEAFHPPRRDYAPDTSHADHDSPR